MVPVEATTLDGTLFLAGSAKKTDTVRHLQIRCLSLRPDWGHVDLLWKESVLPTNALLFDCQEADGVVRVQVVGAAKNPRQNIAKLLIRSKEEAAALMAALDVWEDETECHMHLLCDGSHITGCIVPYYNPLAGSRLVPFYERLRCACKEGLPADVLHDLAKRMVLSELWCRGTVELCFVA